VSFRRRLPRLRDGAGETALRVKVIKMQMADVFYVFTPAIDHWFAVYSHNQTWLPINTSPNPLPLALWILQHWFRHVDIFIERFLNSVEDDRFL